MDCKILTKNVKTNTFAMEIAEEIRQELRVGTYEEVQILARGRAISVAVDISEIIKRNIIPHKDLEMVTATEDLINRNKKHTKVSVICIKFKPLGEKD